MATKGSVRGSAAKFSLRGRKQKKQRHQEILAAAFEEFAANGYAATRLEDVARRGGIAKGTIYLYFKDKQGLFRAVVRSLIHPALGTLATLVGSSSDSAEELLRKLLSGHYALVVRNKNARAILRLLIAESGKFPQLSDIFHREIIAPGVTALRRILEKGVASGEFRKAKIKDFPQILVAPGVLATFWILIHGERHRLDLNAYISAHMEFVLSALRKTDAGGRLAVLSSKSRKAECGAGVSPALSRGPLPVAPARAEPALIPPAREKRYPGDSGRDARATYRSRGEHS
jgi:AcrR family transcriptional regulator